MDESTTGERGNRENGGARWACDELWYDSWQGTAKGLVMNWLAFIGPLGWPELVILFVLFGLPLTAAVIALIVVLVLNQRSSRGDGDREDGER
jgi:hypothetical protein